MLLDEAVDLIAAETGAARYEVLNVVGSLMDEWPSHMALWVDHGWELWLAPWQVAQVVNLLR